MAEKYLKFETFIPAHPEQVFHAFTNASALREWLCDLATVDPRPGGRMYLYWNSGYYSSGEYLTIESDQQIGFSWCGRSDPGRSQVHLHIEQQETGTRLILEHEVPKDGPEWDKTITEIEKGWQDSLENLASVIDTGMDLRYINRPMLGIYLSDFNAELAEKLGVPVTKGMRIDSIAEGLGAQAAGLRNNDVIVRIAGQETSNFFAIPAIMEGRSAGEWVQVEFYRGAELMSVSMELSRRQMPEIAATPEALAQAVEVIYDRCVALLDKTFTGVSYSEADFHPSKGEWNAKEVLAHLIVTERNNQFDIADRISGFERWADDWTGNVPAQVQATVVAFPTLAELLDELKRLYIETAALLRRLPQSFVERRGSYWQVAFSYTQDRTHLDEHIEQINAAIEAARKSG
jgi:uncharacterized protein YndB with AHSA1/START domain